MKEINTNLFRKINAINKIDYSHEGPGQYGFIVSDDKSFYLPKDNENKIHHEDTLKFTILKLFMDEKKMFLDIFSKKLQEQLPENLCFVDKPELIYSYFLTSLNNIIFMNTSYNSSISGLLFVPEDSSSLSTYQKNSLNTMLEEIKKNMDYVRITTTPSLDDVINNNYQFTEYEIDEYKALERKENHEK